MNMKIEPAMRPVSPGADAFAGRYTYTHRIFGPIPTAMSAQCGVRSRRKTMRSSVLIVCVSLLTAAAFAQTDKGTLAGTVLNPDGEPAAEASVRLSNLGSGKTFQATAAKDGHYSIPDLPAVQGFSQKGIAIAAAKTITLDVRLKDSSQLNTLGEDTQHFLADQKLHK